STSGRLARSVAFTFFGTGYLVGVTRGFSVTRGRPSATHFARPPFISRAFACPYSCSSQNANAANQLLLSPYNTTVVFGVTPVSGMGPKKTVGEPDLVPGQSPGDLIEDVGFVALQVGERDTGQQVVDASLQHSPHRPDATRRLRATSMRVDRVQIAVDLKRDV